MRRDVPPDAQGRYVLYWMIGARRAGWNFALDRAVDWARTLGKPLLVLEALRADYRWASDRLHHFVLDGMRDNQAAFAEFGVGYYPYVEPEAGAGRGLLHALASPAAVVVTDRLPVFDLPQLVDAAVGHVPVRFEEVDGCGILPLDAAPEGQVFTTAYAFRRYLQRTLAEHLTVRPRSRSLDRGDLQPPAAVPADVIRRWPPATPPLVDGTRDLSSLAIDHAVAPIAAPGGQAAAAARLKAFVAGNLSAYADRQHPDDDVGSGLSPYLHFGHVSAHEVVARVLRRDGWRPDRLAGTASGAKSGWWGASPEVEAFLDQVITWRELGFNLCARRADYADYDSLPAWALATLAAHAGDPRPHLYSREQLAAAATDDPIWNAAQRQLLRDGRIHSYLRMLWGKKILEWTASPREALEVMIQLNDRWAVDGRDPNSYSGIFWVLGRYDRPWPERPIFGTVRCMTSASTARKLRLKRYLQRYEPGDDRLRWDMA